jgi:dipeptidase
MCDTQVIRHGGVTYFAKNSDREPDEPQHIRYYPAVSGDTAPVVQTTYIAVEQVPDRPALVLSQPCWMWGAEMGVNEHGLVIGNEAVFTRVTARSGEALLGMDLLRLALERCRTAVEAIDCMDRLLSIYGQAGPAGYRDKTFRYDSSFIIADGDEAWVMETAGRHWAARRAARFDAISNALTITDEFERHSEGLHQFARGATGRLSDGAPLHFARAFDTRFMKTMGRAEQRRACSLGHLSALRKPDPPSMAAGLRRHASDRLDFARHGNADVCLHAGGLTRPSQTTASMLAALRPGEPPEIFVTGTSAPCLSLFQPLSFEACRRAHARQEPAVEPDLWQRFEQVHHRALFDVDFRRELTASRDAVEPRLFDADIPVEERHAAAEQWHRDWSVRAAQGRVRYRWYSTHDRFWRARRPV